MFGSDIIEVAIGMAFLYLFMSMIASALREALEAFLQNRAKDLEKGIREMLRTGANGGPGNASDLLDKWRSLLPTWLIGRWRTDTPTWAHTLYDHPMVSSLYKGSYEQAQGTKALPAYIPKENFATALLDVVAEASENGRDLSVATLRATLSTEPNPNAVQRAVLLALSTAGNDLEKVQKTIEDWYDSTMQRVTSWYAKRTALFLFVIGFCAAITLNVDSITIVKRLLSDPPLRQAIVKQAESYTKENKDLPKSQTFDMLRQKLGEVGYPIGWARQSTDDKVNATDPIGTLYPIPQACTVVADDKTPKTHLDCHRPGSVTRALALMGWLITAIAIMLGAPFWFDLLKKLISLRTSINPDEDAEKDAKNQGSGNKNRRRGNPGGAQGGGAQAAGGQAGGGQAVGAQAGGAAG